jgi:hypothetical protein
MKIPKNKYTFVSAINDVPLIKALYDEFIKYGFAKEQALELTTTILKLVIKRETKKNSEIKQ